MYGMISPVTPTALREKVGLPEHKIQAWTSILLSLFSAALLVTAPIIGFISDRTESRRWPYIVGLVGLAAATALLCIGTQLGLWIAGRLCQGAAASIVWVVGVSLVVDTVGKDGLTESIGYVAMASSLGTLAGPLLGGVLYEKGGYYSVFGLAFGFIAIDLVLRLILIEKKHAAQWLEPVSSTPDQNEGKKPGQEVQGETKPTEDNPINPESPTKEVDTHTKNTQKTPSHSALGRLKVLLSSRRLLITIWGNFIISMILTSFDSVLPIFVQETFGWRQSGQGLIFIPLMIPHIASPLTGALLDKYPRCSRYFASGAFLTCLPLLVLLRLVTDNSIRHKILLCALLSLVGVCIAMALPPIDAEAFHAVSAIEEQTPDIFGPGGAMASAFGLTSVGFAAGGLIGPFFAGFIRERAGWGTMGWALGLMAGVSSIPVLLFMGGWIFKKSHVGGSDT